MIAQRGSIAQLAQHTPPKDHVQPVLIPHKPDPSQQLTVPYVPTVTTVYWEHRYQIFVRKVTTVLQEQNIWISIRVHRELIHRSQDE